MERKKASDYPQELLDLFHEYQHGDINRRDFLDRAKKFAVGGVTAMALFESLRPNYAWAEQVKKDDARIKVSYETVASPDGNGSIKGYFARPANASGKLPAVLVIHENRGLNPYVEDVARRFAVANFIAYAPDGLTSVGGFPGNDEEGAVEVPLGERPEDDRRLRRVGEMAEGAAGDRTASSAPSASASAAASSISWPCGSATDLNAGAPFYGRQPSAEDTAKITAPLMLHYADATIDTGVGAGIAPFEAALKANGKTYEKFEYKGAQHGFHNDTTPRYDEKAATLGVDADAGVLQQEPPMIAELLLLPRHRAGPAATAACAAMKTSSCRASRSKSPRRNGWRRVRRRRPRPRRRRRPTLKLPAYCRVDGVIDRRTGGDGKPYGIGFAINLPDDWNGRFLQQGGGGLNGNVAFPLGAQAAGDDAGAGSRFRRGHDRHRAHRNRIRRELPARAAGVARLRV